MDDEKLKAEKMAAAKKKVCFPDTILITFGRLV